MSDYVVWLDKVGIADVESVGGKNASLGEMIGALSNKGVRVPGGFATTAHAFEIFLKHNNLKNKINSKHNTTSTNITSNHLLNASR